GPCFDQCANALTHAQHRTPDRGRSTIQDQLIELVTLLSWSVTHGTGWCGPLPVICRKMRGSSGAGTDGCGTARRRRSSNGQAEWTFRRGSPRGWMSAIRGEEGDFSTAWWQEGSLAADVAVLFARVPVERRHPRAQPAWGAPGAQGHRGPPLGVRWTATMVLGRTPNVSRGRDFSEKILHILLGGARRHRGQLWIHLVRRLRAANRWSRPGLVGRGVRRHGPSSCRRTCRSGRTPAPQGQCSTGAGVFDLV